MQVLVKSTFSLLSAAALMFSSLTMAAELGPWEQKADLPVLWVIHH